MIEFWCQQNQNVIEKMKLKKLTWSKKKKLSEIKKFAAAVKKSDAKAIRNYKWIARAEKKRLNEKIKIIKQIEMIDRKKQREKMKIQKKIKRTFRFKRIYRKRLRESRNQIESSVILINSTFEKKKSSQKLYVFNEKICVFYEWVQRWFYELNHS